MAAGLPCVANAVDGVRDLIVNGENGFRTPPHCPAATADRLIQLLENEDVARLFARRARASIGEEFDIDGMVRRQEALLESLVASSIDSASRTPGGARRVDNKSVNQ
jgi:glycosyltransferase involved in cell wall biosynthesis